MSDIGRANEWTSGASAPDAANGSDGVRKSLSLRLRLLRNQIIASPRFRNAVARVPILRAYSNRKANDLFRLTAGFVFSQVLHACVTLRIFEALHGRALTTDALAAQSKLPPERMRILLSQAARLGLLREASTDVWVLDDLGVVIATDRGIPAMIEHHSMLYRDLVEPEALLRTPNADTETRRFWAYVGDGGVGAEQADRYSRLMRASQGMLADCILASHDFGQYRTLLDLGGGNGAFLSAAATRHPTLGLRLFDLPAVTATAPPMLATVALAQRVQVTSGDFTTDVIPNACDCVTLVRVLCDHDDSRVLAILQNLFRCLRSGTRIIVAEAMDGSSQGSQLAAVYFGSYFLAMGSGKCRSDQEIAGLLHTAGFRRTVTKATPNPLLATLVLAER